jgi:hypothetical protein
MEVMEEDLFQKKPLAKRIEDANFASIRKKSELKKFNFAS